MARYRNALPQCGGQLFLTDGGLETTLVFHDRFQLPHFAAFVLLKTAEGRAAHDRYFASYAQLAVQYGVGCVLESATWRASRDWGEKLGYSDAELDDANRQAVAMLQDVRTRYEARVADLVVSGCVGPRGDGYSPAFFMSADEAQQYHARQIAAFCDADADLVTAITMTYPEEAIGVARAAADASMPVVISFTVETDGRLPSGHTLGEAIEQVDAATGGSLAAGGPAYYMINCAHPTHFAATLEAGGAWIERIRGLRANASAKSHAELNDSPELDEGNPVELGRAYREFVARHPQLNVLGGCCGTDVRHVEEMVKACVGQG